MDQLTCSLGHTVYVDFHTNEIEPVQADFHSMGLTLCLTDTGGSHAGLDTSYARIPADMVYIANLFDKGASSAMSIRRSFAARAGIPQTVRCAARCISSMRIERVPLMRDALKRGDGATYMRLMNESGRSSEEPLNNIITSATGDTKLAQGLDRDRKVARGQGAWRVHGGGFAGACRR